ncbi:hypothetical protein K6U06_16405 [Acidiferrimicrobium sp. IK]|uniref:VOC family protein n=1 Tax=Acidiferrimicrobium sp. IK TaxID=2871700 RepID=UPI0021CAEB54|nr:VOC family protein [Acidiferrimicrobium sp. IK]MCU4185954.1 hypothetical protein [Acidiferrimicrobium sp. IK]
MASRIDSISLDAIDPSRLASFWCAVLGWEVLEEEEGGVRVGNPDRSLPALDLLPVPDRKQVKDRLHLDLRADGTTRDAELARLTNLGARPVDVGQGSDVSWVVLADPEGNEFCLLSRTVDEAAQAAAG